MTWLANIARFLFFAFIAICLFDTLALLVTGNSVLETFRKMASIYRANSARIRAAKNANGNTSRKE